MGALVKHADSDWLEPAARRMTLGGRRPMHRGSVELRGVCLASHHLLAQAYQGESPGKPGNPRDLTLLNQVPGFRLRLGETSMRKCKGKAGDEGRDDARR
jgi:hypothetical protein